eukprot:349929-Chlamydomonas_euryale.AAC.3
MFACSGSAYAHHAVTTAESQPPVKGPADAAATAVVAVAAPAAVEPACLLACSLACLLACGSSAWGAAARRDVVPRILCTHGLADRRARRGPHTFDLI